MKKVISTLSIGLFVLILLSGCAYSINGNPSRVKLSLGLGFPTYSGASAAVLPSGSRLMPGAEKVEVVISQDGNEVLRDTFDFTFSPDNTAYLTIDVAGLDPDLDVTVDATALKWNATNGGYSSVAAGSTTFSLVGYDYVWLDLVPIDNTPTALVSSQELNTPGSERYIMGAGANSFQVNVTNTSVYGDFYIYLQDASDGHILWGGDAVDWQNAGPYVSETSVGKEYVVTLISVSGATPIPLITTTLNP